MVRLARAFHREAQHHRAAVRRFYEADGSDSALHGAMQRAEERRAEAADDLCTAIRACGPRPGTARAVLVEGRLFLDAAITLDAPQGEYDLGTLDVLVLDRAAVVDLDADAPAHSSPTLTKGDHQR